MKFSFAQMVSPGINDRAITELGNELCAFLSEKNYGEDLKELYVGTTCVHPDFDQFSKVRKSKYTTGKQRYEKYGVKFENENMFEYDIKFQYDLIIRSSEQEIREIILQEIINSLKVFDKYRGKIKHFDLDTFTLDLKHFLVQKI